MLSGQVLLCNKAFACSLQDVIKRGRSNILMKKRKCAKFGVSLINEDVMKVKFDDKSWQVIPLRVCPDCLAKQIAEQASSC